MKLPKRRFFCIPLYTFLKWTGGKLNEEESTYRNFLNVSPFKCNSRQADDKQSATNPLLLLFFSEETKKRMNE